MSTLKITGFNTKVKKKKKTIARRQIKTLIPAPKWDELKKAQTEEDQMAAFKACEAFVHSEVTEKEWLHSMKKWIRDHSEFNVDYRALPDIYIVSVAKHGWKAIKLGFMPDEYRESLRKILVPMYERADHIRATMHRETPIHPSLKNLEEGHRLHPDKVRQWLTAWKDAKDPSPIAKMYVANMQTYFRTGCWQDDCYGLNRDRKITPISIALAYDSKGEVKRTIGVYYSDICKVWKGEGSDE